MSYEIYNTKLDGCLLLKPKSFEDDRGCFSLNFNQADFNDALGYEVSFVQDNLVNSHKNVLRGLHYQQTPPQGKLVQVIAGAIFDVVLDLRPNSQTLGQWFGIEINNLNGLQIWVPPGFAHGYLSLAQSTKVYYKVTEYWHPNAELIISWDDNDAAVDWPITSAPRLSKKDTNGISLQESLQITQSLK